jgi:hypothetical protein
MKNTLAGKSLFFFGFCLALFIVLTLLDPVIGRLSFEVQRVIIFLGFVLPAGVGAVLGVMSLIRKEGRPWLAGIAIFLNTAFALFHLMIILFAG